MINLNESGKVYVSLPDALTSAQLKEDFDPKDVELQGTIYNTQLAAYDTLITDLQERIERLQTRNEKLEKLCDLAKSYSANANAEAESVIVELNNNIAIENKKIIEGKRRCNEIDKMREEQKLKHMENVEIMERKFEKTRGRLYSEIKALNAKMNAIEDFKVTEPGLRAKYNSQSEAMIKNEEDMRRTLQQIQYKTIEHRENLKKEAYKKILGVSDKFQMDLKVVVPRTVQRLMRENIVIENELVRLWNDYSNMKSTSFAHPNEMKEWIDKIKEASTNKRNYIESIKIQNIVLQKLKKSVLRMYHLKPLYKPVGFEKECLKIMESIPSPEFLKKDYYKRQLKVAVHHESLRCKLANEFKNKTSVALKKCQDVLSLIKRIVDSAYNSSTRNLYLNIENMDLRAFAYNILNLIDDYNSEKIIFDSESSEEGTDSECKFGLDFEPHLLKIEDITQEAALSSAQQVSTVSKELDKSGTLQGTSSTKSESESSTLSEEIELEIKEKRVSIEHKDEELKMMDEDELMESYYEYEMEHSYEDYNDYDQE